MMAALAIVPNWLKLAGGALVAVIAAFWLGNIYGKNVAATEIEAKAAKEAIERIQTMENNNAAFKNLPAYDRCVAFLRDSGLPIEECER